MDLRRPGLAAAISASLAESAVVEEGKPEPAGRGCRTVFAEVPRLLPSSTRLLGSVHIKIVHLIDPAKLSDSAIAEL